METATSTNEENKIIVDGPKNDQQKLESENFFEKTSPNFEANQSEGKTKVPEGSTGKTESTGNDETEKQIGNILGNGDFNIELSAIDSEDKVIEEAIRLLTAPLLPEENEMSRLAPKTKAANKSVSRPSLSHVNSKVSSELSGQPSAKNAKEDVKNWKAREQELLDRIAVLESKAGANSDAGKNKIQCPPDQPVVNRQEKLEEDLAEKEIYKIRLQQFEKELFAKQKDQGKESNLKGMKNPDDVINHLKTQNEDLRGALAKMTAILRDKTSLCVNQEKKISALSNQVESLKEVVAITKDLLNIRNMEVQHISNDISAMEAKIDCERQRHNQMLVKMDEAVKLNAELKKEYENQLKLFQQLRDSYEEKIRIMSQNGYVLEESHHGDREQKTINGKSSKGSNYKVNFQNP